MPLTEHDTARYDHLRSRFSKMASRLLGEDNSYTRSVGPGGLTSAHRKTRRATASGIINPEEVRRRKRQLAAVQQMKGQMQQTLEERDKHISELEKSEMELRKEEREYQSTSTEQKNTQRDHTQQEMADKLDAYKKQRQLDAEQRKREKDFHIYKSRAQHEQEEARKQNLQQKVERRILHNRDIKAQTKADLELRYQQSRLQRELEMRERELARQERDHEDRRRRAEAEQMRVKRELQETALALSMEEKKRQHVSEEEARQEVRTALSLIRAGRSHNQQVQDQTMVFHDGTSKNEGGTRRVMKEHIKQQEQHTRNRHKDERTMTELELQRRRNTEYRRQIGDTVNSVELQTIGKLSTDYTTLADNKAALLKSEEKFGTWCETKTEELRFAKSVAQQAVESKRQTYLQSTKETNRDLKKTTSRYQASVSNLQKSDRQVHERKRMVSAMAEELANIRRANDRRMKEAALKIRQEEEKLQQRLLREHAELTAELGQRAAIQNEVEQLSHRMTEDTITLALQQKELQKYEQAYQELVGVG